MAVHFTEPEVLAVTGARCLRSAPGATYSAVCTDTRRLTPGCLFVALKGERFDGHAFVEQAISGGAAGVVVSEPSDGGTSAHPVGGTSVHPVGGTSVHPVGGTSVHPVGGTSVHPERSRGSAVYQVADTLHALGALARAHREKFSIALGAVTGSNGKTTTKELIASILNTRGPALSTQGNLNNEVGVPLTLFGLDSTHVAAIVEMGMNHLGEIARLTAIARPTAGLITVVQPAHLQGLGSIEGVAQAKGELFLGLDSRAICVVNLDDPQVVRQAENAKAKKLTFGRSHKAEVRLTRVEPRGRDGFRLTIACGAQHHTVALKLIGEHNALNACAAFALGVALGYRPDECVRGLEAARAHPRRLEILDAANGVTVLDDCYNANPASMAAALDTLATLSSNGRPLAVLGDMLELGADEASEHAQMGLKAARCAKRIAFFGPRMRAAYDSAAKKLKSATAHFEAVEPLVEWLRQDLQKNDVVLVKGSRGMRLERVVEALTGHAGEPH